jgi:hypothetical protein
MNLLVQESRRRFFIEFETTKNQYPLLVQLLAHVSFFWWWLLVIGPYCWRAIASGGGPIAGFVV